jgi:predicted DNA-binding protein (MmcQ/YjbR family)
MATSPVDTANLREIRAICRLLPEVEESKLQGRPLFRVNGRRFAIYNGDDAPPRPRWANAGRSIHLLTDPLERDALGQDGRFVPSPHHGNRGWVALRLDRGDVDWQELAELIEAGYRQAAPKRLVELIDQPS